MPCASSVAVLEVLAVGGGVAAGGLTEEAAVIVVSLMMSVVRTKSVQPMTRRSVALKSCVMVEIGRRSERGMALTIGPLLGGFFYQIQPDLPYWFTFFLYLPLIVFVLRTRDKPKSPKPEANVS